MNITSEIAQNMSPTLRVEKEYDKETGMIITKHKPGDFVVCNLSSINLGKAVSDDVLERVINIQVRVLDNVITHNKLTAVPQAKLTSERYRAIGVGTFGWHHLLALKNIKWETQDAVDYADYLNEKIAYNVIKTSMELAKEKGHYELFEDSDWHTGEYFEKRGYLEDETENKYREVTKEDWIQLMNDVGEYGVRNGYMMAIAPNTLTMVCITEM